MMSARLAAAAATTTSKMMMTTTVSRSALFSRTVAPAAAVAVSRMFSSDCQPAIRLREAFDTYRQQNYTQEVPSRFRKELFSPYTHHGTVTIDELNRLLGNIGRADICLSPQEQQELLRAAGLPAGRTDIPATKLMELIVV